MQTLNANIEQLKIPPHSIDAEHAVLGSLLVDNAAWDEVSDLLNASAFYRGDHRTIWKAIEALAGKGGKFDALLVHEHLVSMGEGDDIPLTYLGQLASEVPSAANVVSYANTVRGYAIRRAVLQAAEFIKGMAYDVRGKDVEEVLDTAERVVLEIAERGPSEALPTLKETLVEVVDRIDTMFQDNRAYTGVSTGFLDLDRLTHGLQPSDLIIIGGRPSMGKTALAMNIVEHAAVRDNVPVGVFSMEMSRSQLVMRLAGSSGLIDLGRLQTGCLGDEHWPRLASAVGMLADAQIHIDDTGALTARELRSRARRMRREHDIGLLVVDYLQLMTGEGENRNLEISGISRALKALAKELRLPVVAISQLNRGVEQRQDKRPVLADLRDSGSIEQDADLVMFVYRDEVYNKHTPDKGTAEVILAKHRNGPIGEVRLTWLAEFTRFENFQRGGER